MKLFAPFSVVVTLFKKYIIPLIQFDGFYLSIENPIRVQLLKKRPW